MDTPPPIPKLEPEVPLPRMSVTARLLNIFAIPGATLEDVRDSRASLGTWLAPILIGALAGTVTLWLTVCQPAALEEFRATHTKNVSTLVAEGKLKQSAADQNLRMVNWLTQPHVARAASLLAAGVISSFRVLGWAFLLWLLALVFLKAPVGYQKTLEVAGLAAMVTVLGSVVALALTTGFTKPPDAHGVSLEQIDARMKSTPFIIQANVFNIWFVALLAAGLARLTSTRFSRTLLIVMGVWLFVNLGIAAVVLALGPLAR